LECLVLLVWVVGGSISLVVYPCVFMSPATAPPHFIDRGGKPYPYVLTIKGKPYPNRVNPHVYPSSTVQTYSIG